MATTPANLSTSLDPSASFDVHARRGGLHGASALREPASNSVGLNVRLSLLERLALMVGIVEIPLQIDKYFMYHESDAMLGAVGGFNLSFTTLALIFLYVSWFADMALHRRRTILRPLLGIPMVFYLGTVLLSSLSASVPMLTYFDFSNLMHGYLLFFFIANRVQTHEDVLFMVLALATTLFIQALIIFLASAIGMEAEERNFGPMLVTVEEGRRHGGTMHSPVLAGSTMALIWLPVASSLAFVRRRWCWTYLLIATGTGMLAILLTQTRGALLTSAIGTAIIGCGLLARGWLPKWTLPMAIVFGVMSIYPMFLIYKKRIEHGDGESAIARKHLSLIAIETIAQRPMFGHGSGNCHIAAREIANQGEYRSEWYFTIHSKYLLVWIETGFIGLVGFLAVLGSGFYFGFSTWRTRDPALSVLGLALFAALAGHSVHMMVDVFNSRTQVQMLWCVLGLTAAVYKLSRSPNVLGTIRRAVQRPGWSGERQGASRRYPLHEPAASASSLTANLQEQICHGGVA